MSSTDVAELNNGLTKNGHGHAPPSSSSEDSSDLDSPVKANQPLTTAALIGEENVFVAKPELGAAMNEAIAAARAWLEETK